MTYIPDGTDPIVALQQRVAVLEQAVFHLADVALGRGDITRDDLLTMMGLPRPLVATWRPQRQ